MKSVKKLKPKIYNKYSCLTFYNNIITKQQQKEREKANKHKYYIVVIDKQVFYSSLSCQLLVSMTNIK